MKGLSRAQAAAKAVLDEARGLEQKVTLLGRRCLDPQVALRLYRLGVAIYDASLELESVAQSRDAAAWEKAEQDEFLADLARAR